MEKIINGAWKKIAPVSAHSPEKTEIDLDKVEMLGYHPVVSKEKVNSKVKRIEQGTEYDPVPVYRTGDKRYEIMIGNINPETGVNDGGHTRAIAYYRSNKRLPVKIKNHGEAYPLVRPKSEHLLPFDKMLNIKDIEVK